MRRHCMFTMPDGEQCRAAPRIDRAFCFLHDPLAAEDAAKAQHLGGIRRRRETSLAIAYDFRGVETPGDLQRLAAIATMEALALDNSVGRVRALLAAATVGVKLLEVADFEERLRAMEAVRTPGPVASTGLLRGKSTS